MKPKYKRGSSDLPWPDYSLISCGSRGIVNGDDLEDPHAALFLPFLSEVLAISFGLSRSTALL
jgi:hypothetical protein